ncbi:MAG: hypothetical protein LBK01_06835 [Burkholderiaceae bacterium]|jgi:hypothetical protein|nr:hypothetical protein [Burkholderiaceae bacterium]
MTSTLFENALVQRNRTLGELVTELRARLGFVAQGLSANYNLPVMRSFLQEAHDFLYTELQPTTAKKQTVVITEAGSWLYDWHNDAEDEEIDPGRVGGVWRGARAEGYETGGRRGVEVRADDNWISLHQGITQSDRSDVTRGEPRKYDTLNGQMELHPIPDASYRLLVEYTGSIPRFTRDSDRPGVPDRLLLLYALAVSKAHYGKADAQAALSTFNRLLSLEKQKMQENRRFLVSRLVSEERTVTGRDGIYTWRGE